MQLDSVRYSISCSIPFKEFMDGIVHLNPEDVWCSESYPNQGMFTLKCGKTFELNNVIDTKYSVVLNT